jgi:hypothetical protein
VGYTLLILTSALKNITDLAREREVIIFLTPYHMDENDG